MGLTLFGAAWAWVGPALILALGFFLLLFLSALFGSEHAALWLMLAFVCTMLPGFLRFAQGVSAGRRHRAGRPFERMPRVWQLSRSRHGR